MFRFLVVMAGALMQAGCAADVPSTPPDAHTPPDALTPASSPATSPLAGSRWLLEEFRSNDDAIGVVRVAEPGSFTLALERDGRAVLRLGCNRGSGSWSTDAHGAFTLGPLATTRALCPPPSLDQWIARDAPAIRSYLIEGDRLYLNLMMDGGTYVWRRDKPSS